GSGRGFSVSARLAACPPDDTAMRQRVAIPTLLACALALAGCQHTGALQAPATTAPDAAIPADDNLNAVLWMQASAEYDAAATQTYRAAIAGLEAALADPTWDALVPSERANPTSGLPP